MASPFILELMGRVLLAPRGGHRLQEGLYAIGHAHLPEIAKQPLRYAMVVGSRRGRSSDPDRPTLPE